jgi:hypothetical protein
MDEGFAILARVAEARAALRALAAPELADFAPFVEWRDGALRRIERASRDALGVDPDALDAATDTAAAIVAECARWTRTVRGKTWDDLVQTAARTATLVEPVAPEPAAPEPVLVALEPVAPEPVLVAPEVVVPEPPTPEAVAVAPEVIVPEPLTPEPVLVAPEVVVPEPLTPEPVAPEVVVPEPPTPEPVLVAPEPAVVPVAVEPPPPAPLQPALPDLTALQKAVRRGEGDATRARRSVGIAAVLTLAALAFLLAGSAAPLLLRVLLLVAAAGGTLSTGIQARRSAARLGNARRALADATRPPR